jgi:hypothetical protein
MRWSSESDDGSPAFASLRRGEHSHGYKFPQANRLPLRVLVLKLVHCPLSLAPTLGALP